MTFTVSVIIPTHNPNINRLGRILYGLKDQNLDVKNWELIIVDNASENSHIFSELDLSWHPYARIIREERLGLTRARIAGIQTSQGKYLVFVDDDNVLDPDYLKNIIEIFHDYPELGAIGGKSLPEFEVEPEPWFTQINLRLGLRDFGNEIQVYAWTKKSQRSQHYPNCAPIGAGMALQRKAANVYVDKIAGNTNQVVLDRTGEDLTSGGDCDINLTLLSAGWGVGYFPQLKLTHLIPASRLTKNYLARLNRALMRSWVQVLDMHGIRPWQKIPRWSVLPRQIRTFFSYKAWKNAASYIRWRGACGMFEGQADLL